MDQAGEGGRLLRGGDELQVRAGKRRNRALSAQCAVRVDGCKAGGRRKEGVDLLVVAVCKGTACVCAGEVPVGPVLAGLRLELRLVDVVAQRRRSAGGAGCRGVFENEMLCVCGIPLGFMVCICGGDSDGPPSSTVLGSESSCRLQFSGVMYCDSSSRRTTFCWEKSDSGSCCCCGGGLKLKKEVKKEKILEDEPKPLCLATVIQVYSFVDDVCFFFFFW